MKNIYHSDIYQFNKPVQSYWEDQQKENLNLDHYVDLLNNANFLFKLQGLLVGTRYSFSQKTLTNFRF